MTNSHKSEARMGQNITPLLFEGEHMVRQVEKNDGIWFVGMDVCRVLGIKDHGQALERLDEDERGGYTVPTPMGNQTMIVVSEPGIYRLVFTSRKPIAERFKRWLAHEVIPSIRKTGGYAVQGEVLPDSNEPRPFPEWPMEELRTKRGIVDMYRLLYGTMAAQWISPQVGFPVPPVELVERGRQYSLVLVPDHDAA